MGKIKLLYIDLFCGAGGTSTGVEHAKLFNKKCAKVVACVNHDANAIASHTRMLTWYCGPVWNVRISLKQRAVSRGTRIAVPWLNTSSDISRLCRSIISRLRTSRSL